MKYKNIYISIFFLVAVIIFLYLNGLFKKRGSVITNLGKEAGFYSMFFFLANHVIYCKENNFSYKIKSDKWLFKYKDGWIDYFEPYELIGNNTFYDIIKGHTAVLGNYSINEYRNIIPEIYKYNKRTKKRILKITKGVDLLNKEYNSIFIRRGDKLISGESKYYNAEIYLKLLLLKAPDTQIVYVQTEDYSAIDELNNYIEQNRLNITIKTLCTKGQSGTIVFNVFKNDLTNNDNFGKNTDYIKSTASAMKQSKPVESMNADEIYDHTITMICGIELVRMSKICVCDYESNVARFIKLIHQNPTNVFNINDASNDINYGKIICPAYSF